MFSWIKRNKAKVEAPDFWKKYLAQFEQKLDPKTPLSKIKFVVFDTETTGLNPRKDKILSIGAVSLEGKRLDISQSYESLLHQEEYNPDAAPVHGILQGGTYEKLSEEEAVSAFVSYCGNAVLVGHNIGFDVAIVNEALKRISGAKLKNSLLDTAYLAIRVAHGNASNVLNPSEFSLDALCAKYGITPNDRHTAAGDAILTAILLMKLISRMEKKGVTTIGQLLNRKRMGI